MGDTVDVEKEFFKKISFHLNVNFCSSCMGDTVDVEKEFFKKK